jgi:hypothetical protein
MITRNYKKEERKENPHGVDVWQLNNKESARILVIKAPRPEKVTRLLY